MEDTQEPRVTARLVERRVEEHHIPPDSWKELVKDIVVMAVATMVLTAIGVILALVFIGLVTMP